MKSFLRDVGDSFTNFLARIGVGTDNVSTGGGYQINYTSHNRFQLESMYRSSWICGKAIDCVAEDLTKRGIDISSDEIEPGEVDELMQLWKDLKIWDKLCEAVKWARLYGGSIALMLIDGQDVSTPLRVETIRKDQFKGLFVFDRWMVTPDLTNLVTELGPDMGQPMYYNVVADARALRSQRIHYSRVIRLEGADLPYWQRQSEQLWGQSVLERLFDRLLAFDSTTQGAAQLVYKAHLRTYKVKNLRELIALGGPPLEGLVKQMNFVRQMQSNEGLTLMDTEDEFETHQYSFGGLDVLLLQFAQQLSGALGIPLTRLFGQSPAGLNSTGEGDLRTYYDCMAQEQELRLRSGVATILALTYVSHYGKALPKGTNFAFRSLWQLTDESKSTIASTTASAVATVVNGGILDTQTALKELKQSSRITGIFSTIDDAAIARASNKVDLGEASDFAADDDEEEQKKAA